MITIELVRDFRVLHPTTFDQAVDHRLVDSGELGPGKFVFGIPQPQKQAFASGWFGGGGIKIQNAVPGRWTDCSKSLTDVRAKYCAPFQKKAKILVLAIAIVSLPSFIDGAGGSSWQRR